MRVLQQYYHCLHCSKRGNTQLCAHSVGDCVQRWAQFRPLALLFKFSLPLFVTALTCNATFCIGAIFFLLLPLVAAATSSPTKAYSFSGTHSTAILTHAHTHTQACICALEVHSTLWCFNWNSYGTTFTAITPLIASRRCDLCKVVRSRFMCVCLLGCAGVREYVGVHKLCGIFLGASQPLRILVVDANYSLQYGN